MRALLILSILLTFNECFGNYYKCPVDLNEVASMCACSQVQEREIEIRCWSASNLTQFFEILQKIDVISVEIRKCDSAVPSIRFPWMMKLQKLIINNCELEEFSSLANLPNLKSINFQYNLISEFPTNDLQHLPNLEFIDFSYNRISEFPTAALQHFPNLEKVIIGRNEITSEYDFECPEDQNDKIIGGDEVNPSYFDNTVLKLEFDVAYGKRCFCSCTVLSARHVVSARHCVFNRRTGSFYYNFQIGSFNDFEIHPSSLGPDVVVLESRQKVFENKMVVVKDDIRGKEPSVIISGYGVSTPGVYPDGLLRKAVVELLNDKDCPENVYCTAAPTSGPAIGKGDSGGALVINRNGQNYLVGVISRKNYGLKRDIHESTHYICDFIEEVTKQEVTCVSMYTL